MNRARATAIEPRAELEPLKKTGDVDVRIVASFAAADEGSALAGNIRGFAEDVADAVEGLSGLSVELIFDDDSTGLADTFGADADEQVPLVGLALVTPRWVKQIGDLSVLDGKNIVPVLWIANSKIPEEQSRAVLDLTDVRRADRDSAQYRLGVEQVAESLLSKMSHTI